MWPGGHPKASLHPTLQVNQNKLCTQSERALHAILNTQQLIHCTIGRSKPLLPIGGGWGLPEPPGLPLLIPWQGIQLLKPIKIILHTQRQNTRRNNSWALKWNSFTYLAPPVPPWGTDMESPVEPGSPQEYSLKQQSCKAVCFRWCKSVRSYVETVSFIGHSNIDCI